MLLALVDIANLLLSVLTWVIIIQVILSWLLAFNVLNTSSNGVRSIAVAIDRLTAPLYRPIRRMLPDFGGIRLLAARDPDPDPGHQEAARWRRDPILFRRMTAKLIDGKAAALALRERIAGEVRRFRESAGRAPGLAVVLVGEHPPSAAYVRSKVKATIEAGMESFEHRLPASVSQDELIALIDQLNADPAVDGILVQLPLPDEVDERVIITRISPDKDVDGFHPVNAGRLAIGLHGFVPCTPLGCIILLKQELGDLAGLDAIVVGRSNIVGKPMAQLLLQANCTVTVAHSRTRDLPGAVRRSDIVVAAVGQPELIRGDWLKPGATVIDVGQERVELPDGTRKLLGDVAFDEAVEVAGAITPVPGGVGPMTIACLICNTFISAARREHFPYEKDL